MTMKLPTPNLRWPLLTVGLLLAPGAGASETTHREHGAHEHGHGRLNLVIDGNDLLIELHMPGVNVVGFEHEPATEEEKQAVRDALAALRRGEELFLPPEAAMCTAQAGTAELETMEHHEEAAHGDEEDEGEETQAEDGEEHEDAAEEAHAEVHAEYRFHCDVPAELVRLEVRLFERLENVEEIDVQFVTPTHQGATELHADDDLLELAPR
jgi:hypothetical protein